MLGCFHIVVISNPFVDVINTALLVPSLSNYSLHSEFVSPEILFHFSREIKKAYPVDEIFALLGCSVV